MPESHSETTKPLTESEILVIEDRLGNNYGDDDFEYGHQLIATIRSRDERIQALEWAARRAVHEFHKQGEKDHAMDATDAINALDALLKEADDG